MEPKHAFKPQMHRLNTDIFICALICESVAFYLQDYSFDSHASSSEVDDKCKPISGDF